MFQLLLFPHPINDRVHAKLKFRRFCNARKSSPRSVLRKRQKKAEDERYLMWIEMKYAKMLKLSQTAMCMESLEVREFSFVTISLERRKKVTLMMDTFQSSKAFSIQWSCAVVKPENDFNERKLDGRKTKLFERKWWCLIFSRKMVHIGCCHTPTHTRSRRFLFCYAWKCHEKDFSRARYVIMEIIYHSLFDIHIFQFHTHVIRYWMAQIIIQN